MFQALCMLFTGLESFHFYNNPLIIPILLMRKPRSSDIISQGHTILKLSSDRLHVVSLLRRYGSDHIIV